MVARAKRNIRKRFGTVVRERRAAQGYSQESFAAILNTDFTIDDGLVAPQFGKNGSDGLISV